MIRRACSIWFAPFAGPPDLYPRTGLSVVAANSGRSATSFWGAGETGRLPPRLRARASAGHPTGRLCPLSAGVRHGLLARLPAVLRLRHRRLHGRVSERQGARGGNKNVGNGIVMATGTTQPNTVPGVEDFAVSRQGRTGYG